MPIDGAGTSPGGASEGLFAVSPSSAGGVGGVEAPAMDIQVKDAVFFEDPAVGWSVGVLLGYTGDGRMVIKDPQQRDEVVCAPGMQVVPVPPAFSKLTSADFEALPSLAHLPPLPAGAREPAVLISLLQRMHKSLWDVPVAANPPLVLSFPGGRKALPGVPTPAVGPADTPAGGAGDAAAEAEEGTPPTEVPPPTLQPPLSDLADTVSAFDSDRCLLLLPTASQASIPTAGRIPFSYLQYFLSCKNPGGRAPPARTPVVPLTVGEGLTYPSRDRVRARCLAVCTLVESLTCYSAPGRPCVSGMCYTVEMVHCERDDGLDGVRITPIAVDHTLVSYLMPHPPLEENVDVVRSPYLAFFQLAESPILPELGLPPVSTLLQLMPKSHFDEAAPSFADMKGALELLGIGGAMGVQVWGVLAAIAHLLLARYIHLSTDGAPTGPTTPGLLTTDQHIAWAAKCLQVPIEHVHALVARPAEEHGTAHLSVATAEAGLASLACHLYERLVQYIFKCVNEDPHFPETPGYSTFLVSLLPFEGYRGVRRGFPCRRLHDKRYMIAAVRAFYDRHAPDRAPQAEYLVNACAARGEMERFISSLEERYNRPRWFSTRERMWGLYEVHRPQLLATVDDILVHYHGREDELFEALESKYGFEASTRPELTEQLEAFFARFDEARLEEVPALARKWAALPDELEAQLSEEYSTSFLQHRREAYALYSKHNPNHLGILDEVMSTPQYAGPDGPAEFVEGLRAKYEHRDTAPRRGAYSDMFRLVRNSIFEVFHLLFMHHYYPHSETIRTRQRLVDMLISTAAPSIVASALDSLTASFHPTDGRQLCEEIVTRFGGGAFPKVSSEDDRLVIEHSLEACSYTLRDVWAMNADPITDSFFGRSGNAMVRGLASGLVRSGTTWISRCVTALTSVMATLATVDSPTSWVLLGDSHWRHSDRQLHIPTVLQQVRGFYVDLIAGEAALRPRPPAASPGRGATLTAGEAKKRQERLDAPLPSTHTTPVVMPALDPDGGGGDSRALGLPGVPMALVAAVHRHEQDEWVFRMQLHEQEDHFRNLLTIDAHEQLGRLVLEVDQFKKRTAIRGALMMRATYTLLAEGILSIEKREKACRARMHAAFRSRCGLYKLQYLEKRCRSDLVKSEHTERTKIAHITGTISAAAMRKDLRTAHSQYFKPKPQPQHDVRRFLELLEEKEKVCANRAPPTVALPENWRENTMGEREQRQETIIKEYEAKDRASGDIIQQQQREIEGLRKVLEERSRATTPSSVGEPSDADDHSSRTSRGSARLHPAKRNASQGPHRSAHRSLSGEREREGRSGRRNRSRSRSRSPQQQLIERATSALQVPLLPASVHYVPPTHTPDLQQPPSQHTPQGQAWAPHGAGDLYRHLKQKATAVGPVRGAPTPRLLEDEASVPRRHPSATAQSGGADRTVSPRRLSHPQLPIVTPPVPGVPPAGPPAPLSPAASRGGGPSAFGSQPPSPAHAPHSLVPHATPPVEPATIPLNRRPAQPATPRDDGTPRSLPYKPPRDASEIERLDMSDADSLAKELETAVKCSAATAAAGRKAITESEHMLESRAPTERGAGLRSRSGSPGSAVYTPRAMPMAPPSAGEARPAAAAPPGFGVWTAGVHGGEPAKAAHDRARTPMGDTGVPEMTPLVGEESHGLGNIMRHEMDVRREQSLMVAVREDSYNSGGGGAAPLHTTYNSDGGLRRDADAAAHTDPQLGRPASSPPRTLQPRSRAASAVHLDPGMRAHHGVQDLPRQGTDILGVLSSLASSSGPLGRRGGSPRQTPAQEHFDIPHVPSAATTPRDTSPFSRVDPTGPQPAATGRATPAVPPTPMDLTPQALRAWADYLEGGRQPSASRSRSPGASFAEAPPGHARRRASSRLGLTPKPSPRALVSPKSAGHRTSTPTAARGGNGSTWTQDRFGTPPTRKVFLHKGQGVLSSDGVHAAEKAKNYIRGYSPHKGSQRTVKGRIPPATVEEANLRRRSEGKQPFVRPQVVDRRGAAEVEAERVQHSFDEVKALVLRLFDIQQQLQHPANQDPDMQRELSAQALRVRQALAEQQGQPQPQAYTSSRTH